MEEVGRSSRAQKIRGRVNAITEWFVKNYLAKECKSMWEKIKGYKTYAIALANVIYHLAAAATGHITWPEAINGVFNSGLAAAIRNGIR